MATPVININMDKACTLCGHMGAGDGGICIDCAAKHIYIVPPYTIKKEKTMSLISRKTLIECADKIKGLILDYEKEINHAYAKSGKGFKINFSLSIEPIPGGNYIEAGISFVSEKIKDTSSFNAMEEQLTMDFKTGEIKK